VGGKSSDGTYGAKPAEKLRRYSSPKALPTSILGTSIKELA
jgi:hypothetical protein